MAAKGGASNVAPRRVLEMMKEATGASDEDICVMLQLCGGDANEATEKLLESGRPARAITRPGPRPPPASESSERPSSSPVFL